MTIGFPDYRSFAMNVDQTLGSAATLLPSTEFLVALEPDMPIARAEQIFALRRQVKLDEGLKRMLLMPQELQLYWQEGEAMGEFFLGNISGACARTVDPSQESLEFFGAPLGNYRIIDEVANVGGPFFTLVQLVGDHLREKLYFFDTRDCFEMSLGIGDYIDTAFATFAPLYWQCLFIEQKLLPSRAEHLGKSLSWLLDKAPSPQLDLLIARLKEKSQTLG